MFMGCTPRSPTNVVSTLASSYLGQDDTDDDGALQIKSGCRDFVVSYSVYMEFYSGFVDAVKIL